MTFFWWNFRLLSLQVTGHSLGGAIASLTAGAIVAEKLCDANRIRMVTFGQPRTGDYNFASRQDQNVFL